MSPAWESTVGVYTLTYVGIYPQVLVPGQPPPPVVYILDGNNNQISVTRLVTIQADVVVTTAIPTTAAPPPPPSTTAAPTTAAPASIPTLTLIGDATVNATIGSYTPPNPGAIAKFSNGSDAIVKEFITHNGDFTPVYSSNLAGTFVITYKGSADGNPMSSNHLQVDGVDLSVQRTINITASVITPTTAAPPSSGGGDDSEDTGDTGGVGAPDIEIIEIRRIPSPSPYVDESFKVFYNTINFVSSIQNLKWKFNDEDYTVPLIDYAHDPTEQTTNLPPLHEDYRSGWYFTASSASKTVKDSDSTFMITMGILAKVVDTELATDEMYYIAGDKFMVDQPHTQVAIPNPQYGTSSPTILQWQPYAIALSYASTRFRRIYKSSPTPSFDTIKTYKCAAQNAGVSAGLELVEGEGPRRGLYNWDTNNEECGTWDTDYSASEPFIAFQWFTVNSRVQLFRYNHVSGHEVHEFLEEVRLLATVPDVDRSLNPVVIMVRDNSVMICYREKEGKAYLVNVDGGEFGKVVYYNSSGIKLNYYGSPDNDATFNFNPTLPVPTNDGSTSNDWKVSATIVKTFLPLSNPQILGDSLHNIKLAKDYCKENGLLVIAIEPSESQRIKKYGSDDPDDPDYNAPMYDEGLMEDGGWNTDSLIDGMLELTRRES